MIPDKKSLSVRLIVTLTDSIFSYYYYYLFFLRVDPYFPFC